MKTISTEAFFALSRRKAIVLTGAALFSLTASPALGKKGGNGGGPPPNPAPVEYQLTWIPGINDGHMRIYDCNTAGIAVGSYDDETGTTKPFCTTADGVITPLDNWWVLPPGYEGWRVMGHEMQINEANTVCGVITNDQTSEYKLFLANLSDTDSLEPVGSILSSKPWWVYMNEHGDVAFRTHAARTITTETFTWDTTLYLYVRSLDKMFGWEQTVGDFTPTGINDNLQVSLVYSDYDEQFGNPRTATGPSFHGSGLLTFITYDVEKDEAVIVIEDLGTAGTIEEPMTVPWGGINNAGTVFGYFETEAPRIRIRSGRMVSRSANTTAGFIVADAETWTELDASLPIGGSIYKTSQWGAGYVAAACALRVNEFGQVVGGYQVVGRYVSEDLWLLDPEDGLFDVNDLVVGNDADVEAFRAAYRFGFVHITGIDTVTGYGIISGIASSSAGFILTPRLIQQP